MKDFLAAITRQLYFIPGTYYLYKFFSSIFPINKSSSVKIITTPFGFKIKVDTSKYFGNKIYWRGAHDWNTILALKKIIRPDDVVFDIGANIGEYTLFAASMLSDKGRVWAFEPVEKMYQILQENIHLNPHLKNKINTIKKAIGIQKATLPIYDDVSNSNEGVYSLHPTNFQHFKKIEEVEIDRLDTLFIENKIPRVDLIKIDVEGNELFVLQSAEQILSTYHPKLMIEVSSKNFAAAGYTTKDLIDFLKQHQYTLYLIKLRGVLKKIESHSELPEFCNIIAI